MLNPTSNTWGTVCKSQALLQFLVVSRSFSERLLVITGGHWFWNNDNSANIVCRQLGYVGGTVYTFGVSPSMPQLPIVAGFRCDVVHFAPCSLRLWTHSL